MEAASAGLSGWLGTGASGLSGVGPSTVASEPRSTASPGVSPPEVTISPSPGPPGTASPGVLDSAGGALGPAGSEGTVSALLAGGASGTEDSG